MSIAVRLRLELHFHQGDQASIFLESGTPAEDDRFAEVLLASLFTARMLVNLGPMSPSAPGLARLLVEVERTALRDLARHDSPAAPALIAYPGSKGRKGFIASLTATESTIAFKVKPWGFGIRARGIDYYAPNAVMLLLRQLVTQRDSDDEYIASLGEVNKLVGQAFLAGRLSVVTQANIAMAAATQVASGLRTQ